MSVIVVERVKARAGSHFFNSSLPSNQFEVLELPEGEPDTVEVLVSYGDSPREEAKKARSGSGLNLFFLGGE